VTPTALFFLGLAAQAFVAASALLVALRERFGLASFVTAMGRWADKAHGERQDVVRLPAECHGAATRLTEGLQTPNGIEAAVLDALAELADARPTSTPLMLLTDGGLFISALAPFIAGLLEASAALWLFWKAGEAGAGATVYARELELVPQIFASLSNSAALTAGLLASLALLLTLRWCLLRPEVRTARMLRAILAAAIAGRPRAGAPTAARLANLMAPPPRIHGGVRAGVAFCIMFTVAWSLLVGASDLRASNQLPVQFDEWPQRRIGSPPSVRPYIPKYPAGRPIGEDMGPSLIVDLGSARLAQRPAVALVGGVMPAVGWRENIDSVSGALSSFKSAERGLSLVVLAHRELPAETITAVMGHLSAQHDARRFHIIVERAIAAAGIPGTSNVQAALTVAMDEPPSNDAPVELVISEDTVRVLRADAPPMSVSFSDLKWSSSISAAVRQATKLGAPDANPKVLVEAHPGVSYDQLVAVLSAADTSCDNGLECGLPGFGVEVRLRR